MEHGDISDRRPLRWMFVFEGLVGTLPPERARRAQLATALGRWKTVVAQYQIDAHVSKVLWDMYWRRNLRFDVVTFMGDGFADALEKRLDVDNLPLGRVISTTPEELPHRLTYMPDVQYVVHADPDRALAYGHRGYLVNDPGAMHL